MMPSFFDLVGSTLGGWGYDDEGNVTPAPVPDVNPETGEPTGTAPTGGGAPWGGGGWSGGGGGGGGGQVAQPAVEQQPWQFAIPEGTTWWPWQQTWATSPWANMPTERAQEAQAWMNVALPWAQAAQQGGQWQQTFDYRQLLDAWQQQFQEQQFAHQQAADLWAQAFQEQQLRDQLAQQREAEAMRTFGHRWRPNTRWM